MNSKFATVVALLTLVLGAPISANVSDKVVQIPLKKSLAGDKSLKRRSTNDEEQLDFTGIRYFANYTVGGQTQTAILDTGSSDTWLFSIKAWSGGFDPSKSDTYKWENNDFSEAYGDGSVSIQGTWAEDTVGFAGAEVPNYSFAYLNQTSEYFSDNLGIFGIGPKAAESESPQQATYVERLKEAGIVQSNSFSLFTGEEDSEASLLIGGIDTAKYKSPLYTLPFETNEIYSSVYYSISFEFQGVKYGGGVLDTGTPDVLLPQNVADSLAAEYGATWNDDYQAYLRSTEPTNLPGLDFEIGGITITIPLGDLFVLDGAVYRFGINRNIVEPGYTLNILGDPILKQLFLLYDIDKSLIAFAPIIKTDESTLVAVGDTIPDSQPAPDQTQAPSSCVIC